MVPGALVHPVRDRAGGRVADIGLGLGLFPQHKPALGRCGGAAGHGFAGVSDPGRRLFVLALLFLGVTPGEKGALAPFEGAHSDSVWTTQVSDTYRF